MVPKHALLVEFSKFNMVDPMVFTVAATLMSFIDLIASTIVVISMLEAYKYGSKQVYSIMLMPQTKSLFQM